MKNTVKVLTALVFIGIGALPMVATAQYTQDFDGLNGSPSGVILTGQDGYFLPTGPPGDVDFMVYTYAGNTLGVVQNPEGGSQFIAGTGPGDGTAYARAQRLTSFGGGLEIWEVWYDFCGIFIGTPPGSNNIGSFSMRQATNTVQINLLTWVDPNNPVAMNSTYVYYDANGTQSPIPGTPPGPEWANLNPNHWYRARMVVDLMINQIIEVAIRDLSGGTEAVYYPSGWFLVGGLNPPGTPDAIRWFGGGGGPGNTTAWDNCLIREPVLIEGACCLPDGNCIITGPNDCPGQYQGDGSDCDPNPCGPNPVEESTWGAIKNKFR